MVHVKELKVEMGTSTNSNTIKRKNKYIPTKIALLSESPSCSKCLIVPQKISLAKDCRNQTKHQTLACQSFERRINV